MEGPQTTRKEPGYEGMLNERMVTVATVLRNAGYRTMMEGKWPYGLDFDDSFALLNGGASHWDDSPLFPSTPAHDAEGSILRCNMQSS